MAIHHPNGLGKKLADAGVIPKHCRRVVIDIPCEGITMVYYECYCDQEVLHVITPESLSNAAVIDTGNRDPTDIEHRIVDAVATRTGDVPDTPRARRRAAACEQERLYQAQKDKANAKPTT